MVYKLSKETKLKLSKANIGKHIGDLNVSKRPEVRKKMSEAHLGKKLSEEHKLKISKANRRIKPAFLREVKSSYRGIEGVDEIMKISKRLLNDFEHENWKHYRKRGCGHLTKCKVSQINLDASTSIKHQIGMVKYCLNLLKENKRFITEAVPNGRSNRRIDIVNLSDYAFPDGEIEIETDHKINKAGAKTIYV